MALFGWPACIRYSPPTKANSLLPFPELKSLRFEKAEENVEAELVALERCWCESSGGGCGVETEAACFLLNGILSFYDQFERGRQNERKRKREISFIENRGTGIESCRGLGPERLNYNQNTQEIRKKFVVLLSNLN